MVAIRRALIHSVGPPGRPVANMAGVPDAIDLDHLAVAAERLSDLWPRYVGDLGGTHIGGSDAPGFRFAQVVFANGMKVEGLEPRNTEENDFLRRFLDASGPGAHHLTFKVPDIHAAIAAAEAAGFPVLAGRMDDPNWMEAFLHPKTSCGIVIQLAQSSGAFEPQPHTYDLPTARCAPAELTQITHVVADLERADRLFRHVLDGACVDEGVDWRTVTWPGGGRVLVATPGRVAERDWLGGRPGRLYAVHFRVADPAGVPGARAAGSDQVVAPADNLGVRLVLSSA